MKVMVCQKGLVALSEKFPNRFRKSLRLLSPVLLIVFAPNTLSAAIQAKSAPDKSSAAAVQQATVSKSQSTAGLPACPPAGIPPAQSSGRYSSHKVVLAWHESSRTPKAQSLAVGYCLYRSNGRVVQRIPTCKECQQINSKPMVVTSCVDDRVQENKTYYYVAIAVNAHGDPSAPTNTAVVRIPKERRDKSTSAGESSVGPVCRSD